jgi:DNA-directed RNA polymerase subunit RPC12/RpoP
VTHVPDGSEVDVSYECDRCGDRFDGRRVVFSTEATDDRGADVAVAKRWVTCPDCGAEVFSRLGMASPWADADGRTLAYPDDALVGSHLGGFAGAMTR